MGKYIVANYMGERPPGLASSSTPLSRRPSPVAPSRWLQLLERRTPDATKLLRSPRSRRRRQRSPPRNPQLRRPRSPQQRRPSPQRRPLRSLQPRRPPRNHQQRRRPRSPQPRNPPQRSHQRKRLHPRRLQRNRLNET